MMIAVTDTGRLASSVDAKSGDAPPGSFGTGSDLHAIVDFVIADPGRRGSVEDAMLARGDLASINALAVALDGRTARARGDAVVHASSAARTTPVRTGFASADGAARAALQEANPISIRENRELGGLIYRSANGRFGYTAPARGDGASFDPSAVTLPNGTSRIGDYHTHGDYSLADRNGNPIRTSDPARDDFDSDHFSATDLRGIASDAHGRPGYRGFLGTPGGGFLEYDPGANRVTRL